MATYKIFISGPSDVNEYIEVAREIITDINMLVGPLGVLFEPFDWLETATPGIGEEPQAVINEQAIGYAAIVAIIGGKVGSPTKEFESGTVEEIEKAILAMDELPFGSKSVMVFFKETVVDIKTLDLEQTAKVQQLRSSLSPKGVLFKDFSNEKKFRDTLLRCFGIILAKHFAGTGAFSSQVTTVEAVASALVTAAPEISEADSAEDDDLGLLELNEMQEALMAASSEGILRISSEMDKLSSFMTVKTDELDAAKEANDQKRVRSILFSVSDKMISFAGIMDEEAPKIGERYGTASGHLRSLIDLWSSEFEDESTKPQIESLRDVLIGLMASVIEAKDGLSNYVTSVRRLPPLTKDVNTAKRKLGSASDRYLEVLEGVIAETESMLEFINSRGPRD